MIRKLLLTIFTFTLLVSCSVNTLPAKQNQPLRVLAVESFIADIAQNVAGDRIMVETLIPLGVDPHGFELTPQDLVKMNGANLIIMNGCGVESWLEDSYSNLHEGINIIEGCQGLVSRRPGSAEIIDDHETMDPHFWLDPISVIQYVENIKDGLTTLDPNGKDIYESNSATYISQLNELDTWIKETIAVIPNADRKIVTNHESFGYFADRYQFQVIGTIIPSFSSNASPSAQQLTTLTDQIRNTGTRAVFLETGTNAALADQLASETGVIVINDLYTHSLTEPEGPAPTYIEMMKWNVTQIVKALGPK